MKRNIVIYGNIYTVDKKNPKASALAISDGRFVYVGDEEGVKEYIDNDTEELRYDKGIILPGFGEGHGHIAPGGVNQGDGSLIDQSLYRSKSRSDRLRDWVRMDRVG